jgi:hypothetical protein
MNKKTFFSFLAILFSVPSFSQTNFSAYGSFIRNLNKNYKANTYGAGIRFEFAKNPSWTSSLGLAYALPMHTTYMLEARAMSNQTTPQTVNVTGNYTQPMYRLEYSTHIYLGGDALNRKGFSYYLKLGVEAIYVGNKATYSDFDRNLYGLGYTKESDVNEDGSDKFDVNPCASFGLGLEKSIGFGSFFLQTNIALPASNGSGDSEIADFAPKPFNINIGYKIPFTKGK